MYDDPSPTSRRRELGARLRELRRARGWTTQDVADRTNFSLSKISRMETGARGVRPPDISIMATVFDLAEDDAAHLQHLASTSRRRASVLRPASLETDYIKIEQSGFLDLERDATWIREFNSGVVPGLLQTRAYMWESMRGAVPDVELDVLDRAIAVRLQRQAVLERKEEMFYEVVIDEAAVRRVVGGPSVMVGQIEWIVDLIGDGKVEFTLIPFDTGAHPGVNSDFVHLGLSDVPSHGVVFAEGLSGHVRFERADEISRYDRVWSHLKSIGISGAEATRMLTDIHAGYLARLEG